MSTTRFRTPWPISCVIGALCLSALGACQSASARGGSLGLHRPDDIAINREQLRLRVRALVGPVTGHIEAAADEIVSTSTDARVQRAALEWKIDAVPAMREALFLPTPQVALMDAWALLYQMSDYFDHGAGKDSLGAASAKAAATCSALEDEMALVAASATVSGDASEAREAVRQWAANHPITSTISARETVNSVEFRKDMGDALSVGESAAEIAIALDDFNRKLGLLSAQLPRQARWELDRQRRELTETIASVDVRPLAERTVSSAEHVAAAVDRLAPSFEGAARAAEHTPEMLAHERQVAVDSISAELNRTIIFAQRERLAALAYLTTERKEAIDDLHRVIGGTQVSLASEVDHLGIRMVDHAIDHIERFVWQVVGALIGAAFGAIVLVRVLFGRPAARSEHQLM